MALLFARVQLKGDPTREQYDALHAKMGGGRLQYTYHNS
jgi:hypothetical protein